MSFTASCLRRWSGCSPSERPTAMLSCWLARLSTICKGSAKPKTVRDIVSVPAHPQHPYIQALLAAIPIVDREYYRTRIILEGVVPSPINPPYGCRFHPRCFRKMGAICEEEEPQFVGVAPDHQVACHLFS